MRYELADSKEKIVEAAKHAKTSKYIGIDTESDSLYSYHEKLCLVQIACDSKIYLIDTLVVGIDEFKDIFENPQIGKIFHSADSDIPLLKTKINCGFSNIFDVMIAAKYIGIKRCGLNNLIERFFSVKLNKKYQKANWKERPIKKEMLDYACMDVYYLKKLKDILIPELKKMGLLEEFMAHCEQFSFLPCKKTKFNPQAWLNLPQAKIMTWPYSLCLKELWTARERVAREKDVPPFKILTNETLLILSREPQKAIKNLAIFKGISEYVIKKHGHWIIDALKKGLNSPYNEEGCHYKRNRPDFEKTQQRFEALRQWRKKKANERRLFPELILTNDILWKIASKENITLQELSLIIRNDHKSKLYAKELIERLESRKLE